MPIVVVSSPGRGPAPHWSHSTAAEIVTSLVGRGHAVRWLAAVLPGPSAVVTAAADAVRETFACQDDPSLHTLATRQRHIALERRLTTLLREWPAARVLHCGLGAGGSLNVLWLADRLGSRGAAIVRAAEVVCPRGDLVDRDGLACERQDVAERCRWCCAGSWWRRTHPSEFLNRLDLVLAGLQLAERIVVPGPDDLARLEPVGLPSARFSVGDEVTRMIDWCRDG